MPISHSVTFRGFDFDFQYNYEPAEKRTYDYPGYVEEFEIFNVTLNGIDASELLEDCFEEFEEAAIENIKSYDY